MRTVVLIPACLIAVSAVQRPAPGAAPLSIRQIGVIPVSLSPKGSILAVGCRNAVSFISVGENRVHTVPLSGRVRDSAWTKGRQAIYIAAEYDGLLLMSPGEERARIVDSTAAPEALALSTDDRFLYVNYQAGGPGGRRGHDAIAKFVKRTGRLLSTVSNLANVGGPLAIDAGAGLLWAAGLDACTSPNYDHVGCPAYPAPVLNIVDLRSDRPITSRSWPAHACGRIRFSPDSQFVFVSSDPLTVFNSRTFETVTTVAGTTLVHIAICRNGTLAGGSVACSLAPQEHPCCFVQ